MKDQLNTFFKDNNFDVDVPKLGHLDRFEKRLHPQEKKRTFSYKWISVAASVILLVGIWMGSNLTDNTLILADVSPEMKETETFFVSTIQQELKQIEKYRNTTTEKIIEDALNQLEKLEDTYNELVIALNESVNDRRVVFAMINNYQRRREILQDLLAQIDTLKKLKTNYNDEIYI